LTSTCTLVWLVPTAYQIGGLDHYIKAVFNLSSLSHSASQKELNPSVLFGRDPAYQAMGRLGMYMVYGLLGGLLPFGYLLSRRGLAWLKSVRRLIKDERVHVLVLWLLPIFLIWAPRVKAPGHTLSFLPGLLLLAGWGLTILRDDLTKRLSWKVGNIAVAGIILVNLGFFFLAPPYLFGDRRVAFTTPSYPTIHRRDQCLSERIEFIEQNFSPSNTAIWVSGFDFRHPDYYLRDYTLLGHVEDISPWANLPTEIQKLVVFSEDLNKIAATYDGTEATALPGGEFIYTLTAPHYDHSSTVTGAPD
jgi:hypothetical protein